MLPMALNLKNEEVEKLAREVAELAGETKTEAIRRALLERKERLALGGGPQAPLDRAQDFLRYLADEVWPHAPAEQLGRAMTRDEENEILGFGPEGV
jgi:antitoxin VapB